MKIVMDSMNLLCVDIESNAGDGRGLHGRRGEFEQHKTMDNMARDRAEKRATSSKQLVNSMVERRAQLGNYTSGGGDNGWSGSFSMTMEA